MRVWNSSGKKIYQFFSQSSEKNKRKHHYKYASEMKKKKKRNLNLVEISHTILNVTQYRQNNKYIHNICAGIHV